jgi:glycosyltransferase involved in cell wall biosynthesis
MNGRYPADGKLLQVTFVCPTAAPLFDKRQPGYTGGMEKRAALFAKGLSQGYPDCRVAILLRPAVGRLASQADKIQLVPLSSRRPWLQRMADDTYAAVELRLLPPLIKLNDWDASLLWKLPCRAFWGVWTIASDAKSRGGPRVRSAFSAVPADVMLTFGANLDSADAIASARRYGITSVLATASDSDLHLAAGRGAAADVEHRGPAARFCLTNADQVIVQTERQRQLLLEGPAAREAVVIRNPVDLPASRPSAPRDEVLWVGRSDEYIKRPAVCLELAKKLPHLKFTMIMNRERADVHRRIVAAAPANVSIVDHVQPEAMPGYFHKSVALINTSPREEEGFPNVFLEAGAAGTVVVSLEVDPDGLLSGELLGICCQGDLNRMAQTIEQLFTDQDRRRRLAEQAESYVRTNHELESQVGRLHGLLASIARRGGQHPASEEQSAASLSMTGTR